MAEDAIMSDSDKVMLSELADDQAVMGAGIRLSDVLGPFLAQHASKLDTLADVGVLDRHQLDEVRRLHVELRTARIRRVENARAARPPSTTTAAGGTG